MSKIAVIYWSGTGNTAMMANEIAAGIGSDAEVFSVDAFHGNVADYDKIAFGCAAMGDEVLEEAEFEPFFSAVEGSLKGKKLPCSALTAGATVSGCATGKTDAQKLAQTSLTMV